MIIDCEVILYDIHTIDIEFVCTYLEESYVLFICYLHVLVHRLHAPSPADSEVYVCSVVPVRLLCLVRDICSAAVMFPQHGSCRLRCLAPLRHRLILIPCCKQVALVLAVVRRHTVIYSVPAYGSKQDLLSSFMHPPPWSMHCVCLLT